MKNWSNSLFTGFILGVVCPPLAFYVFCIFEFKNESVFVLLRGFASRNVLTHVISLSVLINLPLFFTLIGTNRDYSGRGVIGATFLYAFVVLILKLY